MCKSARLPSPHQLYHLNTCSSTQGHARFSWNHSWKGLSGACMHSDFLCLRSHAYRFLTVTRVYCPCLSTHITTKAEERL